MNIAVISFTHNGRKLAEKVAEELLSAGHAVSEETKCAGEKDYIKDTLSEWTAVQFESKDALVFIGAAGIAVRAAAPYVRSKTKDPAVLVIDEAGRYCIPLLSGHIGRANELAELISVRIQAEPVITTATDIRGKWAVDVFASKNGLWIHDLKKAKEISVRLLEGRKISIDFQDMDIGKERAQEWRSEAGEKLSKDIVLWTKESGKEPDISVGIRYFPEWRHTLYLIPRSVAAGIGCRRGTSARQIADRISDALEKERIFKESLYQAASIDLKAEEQGLLEYCEEQGIPLKLCSLGELQSAEGAFQSSDFVREVTGVDNVCERSAVYASGKGKLIAGKRAGGGVTTAFAVKEWRIRFE